MSLGIVLGGGGPIGSAWYSGLGQGLAMAGFDPAEADVVIGTSAGATAGAWWTSGLPLAAYAEAMERRTSDADLVALSEAVDLDQLVAIYAVLAEATAPLEPSESKRICDLARSGDSSGRSEWYIRHQASYLPDCAWPEPFLAVTVRASDGEPRAFAHSDEIPLVVGVAASASAPGLIDGVLIGDDVYFDGGARSATNADLAASCGLDRCLVASPIPLDTPMVGEATARVLDVEVRSLREAGIRVATLLPSELEAKAFGWNLLDVTRTLAAVEAGIERGRVEGARLRFE